MLLLSLLPLYVRLLFPLLFIVILNPVYSLCTATLACTEAVRCSVLKAPAKAALMCSPVGVDQVCWLNCDAGSQFTSPPPAANRSFTTRCGPQTDYRWTHEAQNLTLPSCSGLYLLHTNCSTHIGGI